MLIYLHDYPNYTECIELLYSVRLPESVIDHSIFTCITALDIANRLKKRDFLINCNWIISGSLLHDIGRSQSHDINHGIIGTQILIDKGYSDNLSNICSVHLFAGLTANESKIFNLPIRDFLPITLEEKIITHSDNISKGEKKLSKSEMINRFTKYLDKNDPILIRAIKLYEFIESLLKVN